MVGANEDGPPVGMGRWCLTGVSSGLPGKTGVSPACHIRLILSLRAFILFEHRFKLDSVRLQVWFAI